MGKSLSYGPLFFVAVAAVEMYAARPMPITADRYPVTRTRHRVAAWFLLAGASVAGVALTAVTLPVAAVCMLVARAKR